MPRRADAVAPDDDLHAALRRDPAAGWRLFVERHTETLLALIERAGVRDRDEAMEVYTRTCGHLAADGCARLRRHDPAKGALGAWLAVVVRHVVVDWIRSRAGRRRVFKAVRDLPPFDRRVFELYYWEGHRPSAVAELLHVETQAPVALSAVLASLERIHGVLEKRQRAELVSTLLRARPLGDLFDADGRLVIDVPGAEATPEDDALAAERERQLAAAVAVLPAEDAAIVRLRFVQGLSLPRIRRALHLAALPEERLQEILDRLRAALELQGIRSADAGDGLAFFDSETPASVPGIGRPVHEGEPE